MGVASSSVAAVKERNTQVLEHLAEEFNLTYTAFGSLISPEGGSSSGALTLTEAWSAPLEPAPETPTDEDSAPWQLFSGTVKATYNAQRGLQGDDNIFVSPGVLTANFGRPLSLVCCEHGVDVHVAVEHRFEALLESHASYLPVWPPRRGQPCWSTEQYPYGQ